jgi:hypothetical protein
MSTNDAFSILDVINDPFTLTITDVFDQKYYIDCFGLEHTIEYIKFVLTMNYGLQPDNICLFLDNRELLDYKSFYQSGVRKTSNIKLFIKFKSGRVFL